jgi:hypothetical protein
MAKKQATRGRRPKREGERLSKNRTFRVRGVLDDQLLTAAAASGRSVSEEIEYRLERSFEREDPLENLKQMVAVIQDSLTEQHERVVRLGDALSRAVRAVLPQHYVALRLVRAGIITKEEAGDMMEGPTRQYALAAEHGLLPPGEQGDKPEEGGG